MRPAVLLQLSNVIWFSGVYPETAIQVVYVAWIFPGHSAKNLPKSALKQSSDIMLPISNGIRLNILATPTLN